MRCKAPAKLNLFLHITGRRPDGYHNLQTLFQLIDLCDELQFGQRDDGKITITPKLTAVTTTDNLIYRAAALLQQTTGCQFGADIQVQKNIPMGAGLGGGSSDAATTLLALNQLWQTGLAQQDLMQLGTRLGADVPIFIFGKAAWAEGIGEKLHAVDVADAWYVILIPDCHVSTQQIFEHPDLPRDHSPVTISDYLTNRCNNDCEKLVRQLYPAVDAAFTSLTPFAKPHLTGTGGAVFASFKSKSEASTVMRKLPNSITKYIAQSRNTHCF